jgi:hypothetical protein
MTYIDQFKQKVENRKSIKTRPDCLFYVSEKKCDALNYMECRDCLFFKPKARGAKQEIERAIKDYEKFKTEQCRAK